MIEQEYDVIVVGIGPGGSSVCKTCAEAGLKVLGIERKAEVGSPKQCAEALSKNALKRMGIKLNPKWIANEIYGQTVYAPNGKFVRIDYPEKQGWIVERKIFDKHLAYEAARAGAKILAKTECTGLIKNNNKICGVRLKHEGEELEVKAKIVVACDGVESKLAREAGLDTTLKLTDITSCAQFEMAGVEIDDKRVELYFGNEIAAGGYAWCFPKGKNIANVGIGVRKPFAKDIAYNYLKRFVNSKEGLSSGSIIEVNAGGVPVGGLLKNMVLDNFMVVGDAAHQVNPIHGGGISEAYVAGKIAGEMAIKAIKIGDCSAKVLAEYNKRWWELRGKKMEKLVKLRQVVEFLSDDELNWLAEYLTGEDLVDLASTSGFKKFALLLMKKPKLITLARKLL